MCWRRLCVQLPQRVQFSSHGRIGRNVFGQCMGINREMQHASFPILDSSRRGMTHPLALACVRSPKVSYLADAARAEE
jgi:hypothetical protein